MTMKAGLIKHKNAQGDEEVLNEEDDAHVQDCPECRCGRRR